MYSPIPNNLPPFYKSAVTHLLNKIKTISDIKKQRNIFENFCRKYTMIAELWEYWAWLEAQSIPNPQRDEKFQKILLKLKYRCIKHLNHEKSMKKLFTSYYRYICEFPSINAKYLIKLIETPKYDYVRYVCRAESHEKQISGVKNMEQRFNIPHSNPDETLKLMDKFLVPKTDKNILSIYNKNAKLYDKILAAEKNDNEWIKILAEVNDIEFLIQNVECKIAKNPGNTYLWNLYIQYLNSQNNFKVLDIYRKFCRLFIEDVGTKKAYKYNVTEYFIDTINYEIDFGLVKNAVKLLEEALKIVKFQPKRLFTFAKKFIKKNGYERKLKNAIEKCKLRLSKSKYSMDVEFRKDLKIFVEDLDPINVALNFNEKISRQYLDFPSDVGLQNHETCITSMTAQKLLNFNRNEKLEVFSIDCTNILLDPKIFMQFIKKNAAPKSFFIIFYYPDASENIQHYQAFENEAYQLQTSWAPIEEAPTVQFS